jgi:hypothetical protein
MARKTFDPGDAVEIQRDVDAPWEPAVYDRPRLGQERSGWHIVKFAAGAAPRVIEALGRTIEVDWVAVPSVRIRAKDDRRRVTSVDRSPMNSSRWLLTLECGHEHWVTSHRRPSAKMFPCRGEHKAGSCP